MTFPKTASSFAFCQGMTPVCIVIQANLSFLDYIF